MGVLVGDGGRSVAPWWGRATPSSVSRPWDAPPLHSTLLEGHLVAIGACPKAVGACGACPSRFGGPFNPNEAPPRPLDATDVGSMVDEAPRCVFSLWHGSVTWQGKVGRRATSGGVG